MTFENFVTIDFETANRKYASACQVALAKRTPDGSVTTWKSFVRPNEDFSHVEPRNLSIHGIRENDFANAPTILEIWPEIQEFIGGDWLIAHNASFDIGVLKQSLESWGSSPTLPKAICSLRMARKILPDRPAKLAELTSSFGIPLDSHHDAEADAAALALLVPKLVEASSYDDFESLYRDFGYTGVSVNNFRGNQAILEIGRLRVEEQQEEIRQFFSQNVDYVEVDEALWEGSTVGVIRSVFGMNSDQIARWVELLGGTIIPLGTDQPWPDLIIVGNTNSEDPLRKSLDTQLLLAATKAKVEKCGQDRLFELIASQLRN